MGMIYFDKERAGDWWVLLQKLARDFEEQEARLAAIIAGLDMEILARESIDERLHRLRAQARDIREGLEMMATFLGRADAAYADADRTIAELVARLTEEWREAERSIAPLIFHARIGLNAEDVKRFEAVAALDLSIAGKRRGTAYFKPLGVKFEILDD